MSYQIVMDRETVKLLQGLARFARWHNNHSPTKKIEEAFEIIERHLESDRWRNYRLLEELKQGLYRYVVESPGLAEHHGLLCLHDPAQYAELIDDLLDPERLETRCSLVTSAMNLWVEYYGRTNSHLREAIQEMLDLDAAQAEEELDELVWGELL